MNKLLTLFLFICCSQFLSAQTVKEVGFPLITNHSNSEYMGGVAIENIVSDEQGMVYMSSDDKIFQFNGSDFKLIFNEKQGNVSSLALDGNRIYYAADNGSGFISLNEDSIQHTSISDRFEATQSFIEAIRVYPYLDGFLFIYTNGYYHYSIPNDSLTFHKKTGTIQVAHEHEGEVILQVNEVDLVKMKQDTTEFMFRLYDGEKDVLTSVRGLFGDLDTAYVAVRYQGIYQRKGKEIRFIESEASNDMIIKRGIFFDQISPDNYMMISITDGVIFYDKDFNRVYNMDVDDGILNNFIFSHEVTKKGDLLLGTISGISILHLGSAFTKIDTRFGLPTEPVMGFVEENWGNEFLFVIGNEIYTVHCHGEKKGLIERVVKIDEVGRINAFLWVDGEDLFFNGSTRALYQLNKDYEVTKLYDGAVQRILYTTEDVIVFTKPNGVYYYDRKSESVESLLNFNEVKLILAANPQLDGVSDKQQVWIGDADGQIYLLQLSGDSKSQIEFRKIGSPLTDLSGIAAHRNTIFVDTDDSTFIWDEEKEVFENIPLITNALQKFTGNVEVQVDHQERVWIYASNDGAKGFQWTGSEYQEVIESPEISRVALDSWVFLSVSRKDVIMLAPTGLFHGDLSLVSNRNWFIEPYIKSFSSLSGDTSFYNGIDTVGNQINYTPQQDFTLSYLNNNFRIEYGVIEFDQPEKVVYRTRLRGLSDKWSAWGNEADFKEYTNLHEGRYTFELQAKNVYEQESKIISFQLEVFPPWYRTTLAYIGYGILGIGFIYLLLRLNGRRLEKQKKELQRIVEERTQEIREQNEMLFQQTEEINAQAENLQEINDELTQLNDTQKETNRQLSHKNQQITDSIQYAKRIQSALLPAHEKLTKHFKDSFIYFNPKDIVSGDFYWVHENEEFVYICVSDCTGHGVPGGFMSVLGINTLERIVQSGVTMPNQILDELSKQVKRLLQEESDESVKDGMDLTIVAINKSNNKAFVAGVENPVYIIRGEEVIQLKSEKTPIGQPLEEGYSVQEFDLQSGDAVYQFTDGFMDQKGGPKNKKYFYPPFRKLLVSYANKTMCEQKEALSTEFDQWKGNKEQLDDVCIVGYRV